MLRISRFVPRPKVRKRNRVLYTTKSFHVLNIFSWRYIIVIQPATASVIMTYRNDAVFVHDVITACSSSIPTLPRPFNSCSHLSKVTTIPTLTPRPLQFLLSSLGHFNSYSHPQASSIPTSFPRPLQFLLSSPGLFNFYLIPRPLPFLLSSPGLFNSYSHPQSPSIPTLISRPLQFLLSSPGHFNSYSHPQASSIPTPFPRPLQFLLSSPGPSVPTL